MMMGPQGQGMMMRGGPMMVGGMNGGQHPGQQMGGGPMNMGGMGMGGGQQPMGVPQMGSSMNPGMGHPMTPHMQVRSLFYHFPVVALINWARFSCTVLK